jgi:ankyrin repeat protein
LRPSVLVLSGDMLRCSCMATSLFMLLLALAGCSKDAGQGQARQTLKRLGIPYSHEALMERLRTGDPLVVDLFVAAGMDLDERDKGGETPLMRFAMEGNSDVAQRLIAKGADVNAKDNTGATPLMAAAGYGHTTIAQLLIAKGAAVNAQGNEGETALMQAALNGHPTLAKLLLDHGADVHAKTKNGRTALQYAQEKGVGFVGGEGRPEVVTLLKQAGAQE